MFGEEIPAGVVPAGECAESNCRERLAVVTLFVVWLSPFVGRCRIWPSVGRSFDGSYGVVGLPTFNSSWIGVAFRRLVFAVCHYGQSRDAGK